MAGKKFAKFKKSLRTVLVVLLAAVLILPPLGVLVHRWAPVPMTYLMVDRAFEGEGLHHKWRPLKKISPNLVYAVIAAEDAKFCTHHGFDFDAIEKAMKHNEKHRRVRGGSTISQQTAKNVFLWPQRSWVRKGLEAYYTVLIEALWPKKRIIEVYLNVVEWAPGVYGAEAASQKWYGKSADKLTKKEAARLAAILPSPRKWKAAGSGPYVRKRSSKISAASGTVRHEGLATCVYPSGKP
ncbi:monofunctional biosynthetic peptidoglycan transglycosylase [Caulobacter sp. 17J80-11]|uniref:monofunctional biosynthetic peptidoglycan transglycosylase n=1 Tax=Caulobacter sp. 17J80-11 TaxID=2763502 RepID=UPI00165397E0|nr:monofunctional biosynthetic peptidoglycan transglycosylase [Caulobacter sp. 17J80-11]MBC6983634.1 monofunctional biosynthetic peptidoglycan transglycosylase [Caulobacter sp. 17J80-11]